MKNLTSKLSLAAALTLAMGTFGAPVAHAEEATPVHVITGNVALTNEYRYRGISQTRGELAVQGGADYTHSPSGMYAGVWASTIKWVSDAGGDANIEIDLYGGKRGEIAPNITYDVGGLYYNYPSNGLAVSANTFEVYGQIGWGPGYIKYSHSTTNLFGFSDSKGSGYLDIGTNVEVASGLTLNIHAGRQRVAHNSQYSYSDLKLGLTKDFGFAALAVAVVKAQTDQYVSPTGRNLAKTGVVVSLSKTF
jgi:uncharacterized protein (TIGR02001 family)